MNKHRPSAPPPIMQSKLTPPASEAWFVLRKDAQQLLAENDATLVLICAPAGYGKTTLLTQWRDDLICRGIVTPWYSPSPADDNLVAFITYLLAGLEKIGCSIPLPSEPLSESLLKSGTVERILVEVINHVHAFEDPIMFFLDNVDVIEDEPSVQFIEELLYNAPTNLQFAMATRRTPKIRLGRLSARGKVLKIGTAYLRFDYRDTCELISAGLGRSSDADICQKLYQMTEGWPGALQLAISEIRRLGPEAELLPEDKRFLKVFFEFIEQDVLRSILPEVCGALSILSLTHGMPKPLYRQLTGGTGADLNELADTDPLLESIDRGDHYRCPPLLQAYFKLRLKKSDPDTVASLHHQAGVWFEEQNNIDSAIEHFLAAKNLDKVIELLEQHAHRLSVSGHSDRLLYWMERLPVETLNQHPKLMLAQAWAWALSNNFARAPELLDNLEAQQSQHLNQGQLSEIFLLRAVVGVYGDNVRTVHRLMKKEHCWSSLDDPFLLSVAADVQSWYYLQRGEFEKARSIQYPLARWTESDRSLIARLYSDLVVGLSHAIQGDIRQAESIYRKDLAYAEERLGRGSMPASISIGFLVDILYEKNQLQEVMLELAQRFDMTCSLSIPDAVAFAYLSSARARFGLGDTESATEVLEEMAKIGRERKMLRFLASAWETLIWVKLRSNDFNGVRDLQGQLEALVVADVGHSAVKLSADLSRIRIHVWEGDFATAKKRLKHLDSMTASSDRWRLQVQLKAMLANCLQLSGDLEGAVKIVAQACRKGNELGLIHTLTDELEKGETLIDVVKRLSRKTREPDEPSQEVSLPGPLHHEPLTHSHDTGFKQGAMSDLVLANIDADYLETLQAACQRGADTQDKRPSSTIPAAEAALSHPADMLTLREKQVLKMVVQGLPNKHIARSIDVSMDTVKWHIKNLYKKLGVHDRTSANLKARQLSLIDFE